MNDVSSECTAVEALRSLSVDDAFFVGSGGQVLLYCTVLRRRADELEFVVENGAWRGTLSVHTGALLSIAGSRVSHPPAFNVVYTGPIPKGIAARDYNKVIAWVQKTIASQEPSRDLSSVTPLVV